MSDTSGQRELAEVLARLESDRGAIPWPQRRSLAASLGEALVKADQRDIAIQLVHLLAHDSKWEVRREIASLLPSLPDDEFAPLAARLTQDVNSYVRKAAERGLSLWRKGIREVGHRRKGLDQVLAQVDLLEAQHGKAAADKVGELATRLYEALVGATVHDLRGVLTSARANLARLEGETGKSSLDRSAIQDGLRKVALRLEYLERFVEDMATYSQPVSTERVPTRLVDVVSDAGALVVDALRSAHPRANPFIESISVDDGITVTVVRHQIVAAIVNVLKNAHEAVLCRVDKDHSGCVALTAAYTRDDEVRIVIQDNGVGMDTDALRAVSAFVPGHTTKKGSGTGFGLPIAQRYIGAHGGAISIDSVEGVGTTVTIVLPIESQQGSDE